MTTSYSKNIHLANLCVYDTLDSQGSLSSSMSIKTGLFSVWLYVVSLFRFLDYRSLPYYRKLKKKSGELKNKFRTRCPIKIMKILGTASQGSSFTGSYKKLVYVVCRYVVLSHRLLT